MVLLETPYQAMNGWSIMLRVFLWRKTWSLDIKDLLDPLVLVKLKDFIVDKVVAMEAMVVEHQYQYLNIIVTDTAVEQILGMFNAALFSFIQNDCPDKLS